MINLLKHYTCLTLMMQAGMTHFLPDFVGTYHTWVGLWLVFLFWDNQISEYLLLKSMVAMWVICQPYKTGQETLLPSQRAVPRVFCKYSCVRYFLIQGVAAGSFLCNSSLYQLNTEWMIFCPSHEHCLRVSSYCPSCVCLSGPPVARFFPTPLGFPTDCCMMR